MIIHRIVLISTLNRVTKIHRKKNIVRWEYIRSWKQHFKQRIEYHHVSSPPKSSFKCIPVNYSIVCTANLIEIYG